jgi:hypothetical protein
MIRLSSDNPEVECFALNQDLFHFCCSLFYIDEKVLPGEYCNLLEYADILLYLIKAAVASSPCIDPCCIVLEAYWATFESPLVVTTISWSVSLPSNSDTIISML